MPVTKTYTQNFRILPLQHSTPMKKTMFGLDHGTGYYTGSTIKTQEEEAFQKDAQNEWSFGSDEITSFTQDHERNIWMGGRNSGLHVYNKKLDRFYNYQYDPSREGTLADNRVNCIYIDRSGIVWIGTNKGVSIHNPSQQQFRQTFLPKLKAAGDITINDFYSDRSGHLWLATSEGLFLRRNGESSFTHKPLSYKGNKLNISKFFLDADGRFYLGTNYSLFSYDVHGNNLSLLLNTEQDRVMNKIIASRVVSVIRDTIDNNPVLLVSPYGHFLAYYDLVAKRWISRLDSTQNIIANFNIRDNLIRRFYRNSAGKIWLATVKEGLGEWVKNSKPRIKYYKNDPGRADVLSNNNVFDIAEDKNGILWITTYGGGLHYFDQSTGRFTHIGASSNLLEGMQIDSRGFIWMVGNGNLHRYDPTQRSYTSFDLPDIEKSGGVRGYIYKDASGRMYVGGLNYFVEFNPLSIRTLRDKPKVYFTDFKIFNNSYSDLLNRKNVSLNYNQNYFTIEFSAPHYSAATRVQYAYQLEGIDENWIEAGERNSVPYSNLPAGGYVFKVKATNNPGNWNDDVTTINITIVPPFWKTWWFYMICGVFTIMMVYGVYRYRINELLKRQAIRNKIAQDLHDNMGSTLSSISVYSQVAKIQQSKGNYEVLENVLGKIASTSSEMISEMNDIVWAINPRNDSMEKILQRMESFAKPLLAVKNIQFSFNYTADIFGINLEMQKRKNFYLIFKESVNNALKYSGCTSLDVNIGVKGNQLHLTDQDNGAGFERRKVDQSSQSLSGNGLRNMEMRAKEMKGSCSIESHPGKGTTVNLWFPIP